MQINYFSSFLLTLLLVGEWKEFSEYFQCSPIDLLKKSAPSRVVNVSSAMAKLAKIDPNDLNDATASQHQLYGRSKLCNILFTKELAKKLEGTGVSVFSLHPGAVSTDIFRRVKAWHQIILTPLQYLLFKVGLSALEIKRNILFHILVAESNRRGTNTDLFICSQRY